MSSHDISSSSPRSLVLILGLKRRCSLGTPQYRGHNFAPTSQQQPESVATRATRHYLSLSWFCTQPAAPVQNSEVIFGCFTILRIEPTLTLGRTYFQFASHLMFSSLHALTIQGTSNIRHRGGPLNMLYFYLSHRLLAFQNSRPLSPASH